MQKIKGLGLGMLLIGSAIGGCASAPGENENVSVSVEESGKLETKIQGGTASLQNPEVGKLIWPGVCTATLVAPNVIVTAAHCVSYRTIEAPNSTDWYALYRVVSNGRTYEYQVDALRSYSSSAPNGRDVALARLRTPVPASIATPMQLAREFPTNGTSMYSYGIGSNTSNPDDRTTVDATDTVNKNRLDYVLNHYGFWFQPAIGTIKGSPGDSGGPHMPLGSRRVAFVWSGHIFGTSIVGVIPWLYNDLQAQIRTWTGCQPTGCSGERCGSVNRPVATTCGYEPWHDCYAQFGVCGAQVNGCGWSPTPELTQCLARYGRAP
jgi:Trypsin